MVTHSLGIAPRYPRRYLCYTVANMMLIAAYFGSGAAAQAADAFCSNTARYVHRACGFEVQDDYWTVVAVCSNEPEAQERAECLAAAKQQRTEGNEECGEQLQSRLGACKSLGEQRYHPSFEPELFESDYTHPSLINRYFPLRIGNRWEYQGGEETGTVEVLSDTKLVDEVRCLVARDLVYEEGLLKEATDDWFAQAKDGAVWYCGEETKSYEFFEGDEPQNAELVSIDGSFKADRDGAEAGIIFPGRPVVGQTYREEFSLGNAEDAADVLSTTYSYGEEAELDRHVPRQLARLLCKKDCVVTNNYSLLEPGNAERKYYAPGIGLFLELNPDSGEINQLVNCNFDQRCRSLPRP